MTMKSMQFPYGGQYIHLWQRCRAGIGVGYSLVGGEKEPGTHCLRMRQIGPEKWGDRILSFHVRDTMM